MTRFVKWWGTTRGGNGAAGVSSDSPAVLAERLYHRRYPEATLWRGDVEVGGIRKDPTTGKRVWWGEE